MSGRIDAALAAWVAAGEERIGEIAIMGRWELRHHLDREAEDLATYPGPDAAREIALYDPAGRYRPLKTAPTLRRGWRMKLTGIAELREALDGFYPAMMAARLARQDGRLPVTDLRATLERQSGMYAMTRHVSDEEAGAVVAEFCRTDGGCLKTICWQLAPGRPVPSLPVGKSRQACPGMPLYCAEGCNMLVARIREVMKSRKDGA